MDIDTIIENEMRKWEEDEGVNIIEVKPPSISSLLKLNKDIAVCAEANEAMRNKSMVYASGMYLS